MTMNANKISFTTTTITSTTTTTTTMSENNSNHDSVSSTESYSQINTAAGSVSSISAGAAVAVAVRKSIILFLLLNLPQDATGFITGFPRERRGGTKRMYAPTRTVTAVPSSQRRIQTDTAWCDPYPSSFRRMWAAASVCSRIHPFQTIYAQMQFPLYAVDQDRASDNGEEVRGGNVDDDNNNSGGGVQSVPLPLFDWSQLQKEPQAQGLDSIFQLQEEPTDDIDEKGIHYIDDDHDDKVYDDRDENVDDNDDDDLEMDMDMDMDTFMGTETIDIDYDIDYDGTDEIVDEYSPQDKDTSSTSLSFIPNVESFSRDEDEILTEREDRLYAGSTMTREKCILIGVEDLSAKRRSNAKYYRNPEEVEVYFTLEQSMDEMRELISTAGMELAGTVVQRLNEVNPKTYIGTGKVKEAEEMLNQVGCSTVIFDAELSPGQQKSLENIFNRKVIQNDFLGSEKTVKVVDRTALILDIFAQHAKTREGKLQVDLALHEYRKPRLTKMWTHLERQSGAGGVGLRGPGESQLEIDKRLIRDRIIVLKRKIDSVQKHRDIHRKARDNLGLPILALVGYTNAGKSTLLNYLTRAGVMAENILFATLDPTTRKVKLPGLKTHPEVLLTDTVGFIQKLPTQLVAAFRATLEEVQEADLLLHIIDASNPVWHKQEMAVKSVLREIGVENKPMVRVLNKIDLLDPDVAEDLQYNAAMTDDYSVAISSLTGEGMTDLVSTIEDAMMSLLVPIEVVLPYANGKEVNMVQEVGHVEEIDYREDGTYMIARVPEAIANRLRPYFVNQFNDGSNTKSNTDDVYKNEKDGDDEIDWVAIGRGRHTTKNNG